MEAVQDFICFFFPLSRCCCRSLLLSLHRPLVSTAAFSPPPDEDVDAASQDRTRGTSEAFAQFNCCTRSFRQLTSEGNRISGLLVWPSFGSKSLKTEHFLSELIRKCYKPLRTLNISVFKLKCRRRLITLLCLPRIPGVLCAWK